MHRLPFLATLMTTCFLFAEDTQPQPFTKYTQTIPGSKVSFDMLPIPGGTFMQGSPASESGRHDSEGPQHQVELKPFWMGKCEVTWDEYDQWSQSQNVNTKPGDARGRILHVFPFKSRSGDEITRPSPPYLDMTFGYGHDGYPAINLSQYAAMEYCRWLSARTGYHYRLPTEAEWEYACRAGTTTAYSFGDDVSKLNDYAWHQGNSNDKPHPVGLNKPNPWGLHDMHGNVAEWCLDGYLQVTYARRAKEKVSMQPVNLLLEYRFPHVVRGGSWVEDARQCRSATRRASHPSWNRQDPDRYKSVWYLTDGDFVGFRVVRAVKEQQALVNIKSQVTWKGPETPEK